MHWSVAAAGSEGEMSQSAILTGVSQEIHPYFWLSAYREGEPDFD